MKIVFMGTPQFAVPVLEMLIQKKHEILAVVTKPDKERGRGNKVSFCEVKEFAIDNNLNVLQPDKIKNNLGFISDIESMNPDLIITCAYGKILPQDVLDIPRFGCINVHASLLPKYRGASPINKCIIDGEKFSGVTTMHMDSGMDTGDILLSESVQITDDMTAGELHDILSDLGAKVLEETLTRLQNGTLTRIPQDDKYACYAGIMDKNRGMIDWECDNRTIHNLVRGTNPWPVAFTYYKDVKLKIWKTKTIDMDTTKGPGTIIKVSKDGIDVATKKGIIRILEIQAPSKKRMDVASYILGNNVKVGEKFCQES